MDHFHIRRNRKRYPVHKRNLALYIIEIKERYNIILTLSNIIILSLRNRLLNDIPALIDSVILLEDLIDEIDDNGDNIDELEEMNEYLEVTHELLQALVGRLSFLSIVVDNGTDPIAIPTTILSEMSDQKCTEKFRFNRVAIDKLIGHYDEGLNRFDGLLKLPRKFVMGDRSVFRGDVAFLYYVQRQVEWERLVNKSEEQLGKEYSSISRMYNTVATWLYDTWSWRVIDNRQFEEFWVPRFEGSNAKFRARYQNLHGNPVPERYENVAFVYDTSFYQICVPTDPDIEHVTYSHYEKQNGIKIGAAVSFCGMAMLLSHIFGARHNDNFLLREQRLNRSLQIAQLLQLLQYIGYMDKAFFDKSHMKASYNARAWDMEDWMHVMNTNMKKACLASVEWKFLRINNFFGLIKDKRRLKLQQSPIEKYIVNAYFLDNLLIICQGCNTHQSFNLDSPSLEEYLTYEYVN